MLGPAGLSSDSGLGGSTDGSTDILVFGSVVDSVTEEGKCVVVSKNQTSEPEMICIDFIILLNCSLTEEESEESSSGEVEIEQEVPSDPEDPRELHPGALLHRSSRLHNMPLMAEALAHGADVHAACEEEEGKTPLIQAVIGVSVFSEGVSCCNLGFRLKMYTKNLLKALLIMYWL